MNETRATKEKRSEEMDAVDRLDAAQAKLKATLTGMSRDDQQALADKLQAAGVVMPTIAQNARMTSEQRADAIEAVVAAIEA